MTSRDDDDSSGLEATAVELVAAPNPAEVMYRVELEGQEDLEVSREAKDALAAALEAGANPQPVFIRCKMVMTAVAKILGVDMLEYSMPTEETAAAFDWSGVVPGRRDTYMQGASPTDEEFAKVAAVHKKIKQEKDEAARATGALASGIQSHTSLLQRWKQWRDFSAFYKSKDPATGNQTVLDQMTVDLKNCTSLDRIHEKMQVLAKKHLDKLARERAKENLKRKLEERQAEVETELESEKARAKEALEQQKVLEEERKKIGVRKVKPSMKRNALAKKKKEEDAAAKKAKEAMAIASEKKKELKALSEAFKKFSSTVEPPAKKHKVYRKNDVTLLDVDMKPRLDGEAWNPPMKRVAPPELTAMTPQEVCGRKKVSKKLIS